MESEEELNNNGISRRSFLKTTILSGSLQLSGCATLFGGKKDDYYCKNKLWPTFSISREEDEILLQIEAIGFRENKVGSRRCLEKLNCANEHLIIFNIPPQHYAETAIGVGKIPDIFPENVLENIELFPSGESRIVFRVTDDEPIYLDLDELLNWRRFDLVLPQLKKEPRYSLNYDSTNHFTRIEMPWGIELTPIQENTPEALYEWVHSIEPVRVGNWTVVWSTNLQSSQLGVNKLKFEVLSALGFEPDGKPTGDISRGGFVVSYKDKHGVTQPESGGRTTALRNLDRIDLAASLSRRFQYTGKPGVAPIETALLKYNSIFNSDKICLSACYDQNQFINVSQYRISTRGGWLELDANWKALPGCGLSGWTHSTSLGRDHHVKLINAGFLWPFGIKAELVVLSERVFVKDERGHYIAVLVKQAFLQVPQTNKVHLKNETPFIALSVTTRKTPPLDLPPGGDPAKYKDYDFFVPIVDGVPFEFSHDGIDWAGKKHSSKMSMIFVSNKATSANGLIWEPNSTWSHTQKHARCGLPDGGGVVAGHVIPANGDGLRVVDKYWNSIDSRFARYNDSLIALADPATDGDTTQRVQWIEWTRGIVPKLSSNGVAERPFIPRARTLKLKLQGIGDFSGETNYSIATYRDTRFVNFPILDPEPTTPDEIYYANVSAAVFPKENGADPYLHLLEIRDLLNEPNRITLAPKYDRKKKLYELYYGISTGTTKSFLDLFSDIENEASFGTTTNSQSTGGISVPDTHISFLTRGNGPSGDATFNVRRWSGYTKVKSKLEASGRVDYAAFKLADRPNIDKKPFDITHSVTAIDSIAKRARALMGFAVPVAIAPFGAKSSSQSIGLELADIFGVDAQILPGLTFMDIFKGILLSDSSTAAEITSSKLGPKAASSNSSADPFQWNFKTTGIDWLINGIGKGPNKISVDQLVKELSIGGQNIATSRRAPLGIEASLSWNNSQFKTVDLGPVLFTPINGRTNFQLDALARIEFSQLEIPLDGSEIKLPKPKDPEITASATLTEFIITVFKAIEISFADVSYDLMADGKSEFSTNISDVQFIGPLEFIGQLSEILGGLGSDSGVDIDVSLSKISITQKLAFPPKVGQPLLIGPAQIINLVISWGVNIPLIGRDVLSISFGLSSREKPLIIYVPPFYGGKAHILMEVTTKGVRLLEISMEYGALVPISWDIATGEASLTAGIFYMAERTTAGGKVIFRAFVKAVANLDVAGIIHFSGMIYIGIEYIDDPVRRLIRGETTVSVSIKIGFVRVSYSFTAEYVEDAGNKENNAASVAVRGVVKANVQSQQTPTLPGGDFGDITVFNESWDSSRQAIYEQFLRGYRQGD